MTLACHDLIEELGLKKGASFEVRKKLYESNVRGAVAHRHEIWFDGQVGSGVTSEGWAWRFPPVSLIVAPPE